MAISMKMIVFSVIGIVLTFPAFAQEQGYPHEGASFGGKVRSGPGMKHGQVGSLKESKLVTLVEKTNVIMNGYPWFKIAHVDNMTGFSISGYQWGGILCSFDTISGVYKKCPLNWSDNPDRFRKSQNTIDGQDEIAPQHGNSDEDNQSLVTGRLSSNLDAPEIVISKCLAIEKDAEHDGSVCIGRFADSCLKKDDNHTTVAMRQCMNLEHKVWDKLLNTDYQELMKSLDTETKKASLRKAQRLWIEFVTRFCPLSYEFNSGTMFLITSDRCVMEMTARQDLELKRLIGNS